jgi:hypothetical protein
MAKALLTLSRLAARSEPSAGTRIADTRASVAYWTRRADDLSWRRRAERREARTRASSARAQLIGAHVERWGLPTVDRRLTPLLDTGGRNAAAHARSLAFSSLRRTALGRRLLLAATGLAVATVAAGAAVVALVVHFL